MTTQYEVIMYRLMPSFWKYSVEGSRQLALLLGIVITFLAVAHCYRQQSGRENKLMGQQAQIWMWLHLVSFVHILSTVAVA
jgi:hypothetical protein